MQFHIESRNCASKGLAVQLQFYFPEDENFTRQTGQVTSTGLTLALVSGRALISNPGVLINV